MQREDALDSLSERHFADGERRARAAPMQADDHALEDLNALLVAFSDLDVHAHGVARLHRRTLSELSLFHQFNRAHDCPQSELQNCRMAEWQACRIESHFVFPFCNSVMLPFCNFRSISRSSSSSVAFSSRSGRRSSVRPSDSCFRHRRISWWLPDSRTSGTRKSPTTAGRV